MKSSWTISSLTSGLGVTSLVTGFGSSGFLTSLTIFLGLVAIFFLSFEIMVLTKFRKS